MTFLTPTIAGIAAAIGLSTLLILYFLKLRRRDLEVSSTLLWRKAIQDLQANAPFQKLRNNILLILQLIAMAAGLLALAQPQLRAGLVGGARHIVMIDRSASMRSIDGEPTKVSSKTTRLEAAKTQARELVSGLQEPGFFGSAGDEAMVIAFDTRADVVQAFTNNKTELRRAIESIAPTDNPSALSDAFKLAKAHLPKRILIDDKPGGDKKQDGVYDGQVNVHLYSDGRLPDVDKVNLQNDSAHRDELAYHIQGSSDSWNIGVITMRAEREYDAPNKASIFVSLQSTAPTKRTVDVQLTVEGNVVAVKSVEMPAAAREKVAIKVGSTLVEETVVLPESRGVVFEIERAEGAAVAATIIHPAVADGERGDALKVDDVGYLALPPSKRLSVAVVSEGSLWLRIGLEGMRLARPAKFIAPSEGDAFLAAPEAAEFDVIVLDRWVPTISGADGKPGPGLPAGRFLILGAVPPAPVGLDDLGPGKAGVVLTWKRDHPVLRGVQLDDLSIQETRATALGTGSGAAVLAEGPSGPLIVEASDLTRRAVIVTFNPMQSNWPLKPASLIFLAKSLDYLARDAMDMQALSARPGDTLVQRLPRDASAITLALPEGGKALSLTPQRSGEVIYGPVRGVGMYTLEWEGAAGGADVVVGGKARRGVSVNLGDPFESDITPRTVLETASRVVQAEQSGGGGGVRRLWPWLMLAMLGMLVVEWYVYNRKVAI
ncbi:BatA and WFA domain-containing protein [soil metagenome]